MHSKTAISTRLLDRAAVLLHYIQWEVIEAMRILSEAKLRRSQKKISSYKGHIATN